jgi:flagellar biosynthetic protein FliP
MLLTGVALQVNPAQAAPAAAQPAAMAGAQAAVPVAAQPVAPAADQPAAPPAAQPVGPAPAQPGAAAPATPSTAPTAQPNTTVPIIPSTTAPNPNQLSITGLGGGSAQWTIFVLLTFLTLIPSILICMTPFARLLIVFHFLRQALGLQTTPSNQTLIGLSIIMTFFIMQPIGVVIYRDSVVPLQAGHITAVDALTRAGTPMRQFMSHYVREKDAALFLEMAKEPRPASIDDLSFRVLLPAYILSELKAGFQIGAVLFLPFLVVDMVVASITTSVGMMQLPPVVISTPLKLLLFLMVDGWHLLIGALMRSFN